MQIWGLHLVDVTIIVVYVAAMIWLGKKVSDSAKDLDGFFLAGRRLGKAYQFFLNFGVSTHADQAVAVSREVYRQGIGGMWIQSLVLFLTPFYWFTTLFFRRVRLTTIGDFFEERFDSRGLAAAYAVFTLALSAFIGGGIGYLVAGKTIVAMTPKTIEQCTPSESQSIVEFEEFQRLDARRESGLGPADQARYDVLREKNKKGELRSFVSHVDELWFYFLWAAIVGTYTVLGGFMAAAVTDAIQGVLIIVFSILLIPAGLARIGGFAGLHAVVPAHMFQLFGSAALSEYAWYTIFAMALSNLVSIVAVASGMQTAGSARNEFTARIGMIGGMFAKRLLMLCWALAGLLAVGLYRGRLHDPDLIWGFMTRDLLAPGMVGLMLVGVLAGTMSWLGASAVSHWALFIRNLYRPWVQGRSDRHYLLVGRVMIGVTLVGSIGVALAVRNLLELFQYIISVPGIFGAPMWLGFLWRRITKWAVILQVTICVILYAIVPSAVQQIGAVTHHPALLRETTPRPVRVTTTATTDDVAAGRAGRVGQTITATHLPPPAGIFFERVARENPDDSRSPRVGLGRFHAEMWVLSLVGVDFGPFTKPQLVATRFFFDALFPFALLILFSYLTPRVPESTVDRFFAKLHTPVQPTPEADQVAVDASCANPRRFDREKLFPQSQWEIMKPTWSDYVGFGGTWVLVGLVVLLLWGVVTYQ